MFAHHHLDSRRLLRILIFIWTLLLLLVLLPVRTHGQESLEPSSSFELLDNSAASPELLRIIAAEMLLLWFAMITYLAFNARHRGTHSNPFEHRHH